MPSEVQHVQHVAVEYFRRSSDMTSGRADDTIVEPSDLGWMAFADLISHFPRLHSVVFVFTSNRDGNIFIAENNTVLQRLREFTTTDLTRVDASDLELVDEQFYSSMSTLAILVCSCPLNHVRDFASDSQCYRITLQVRPSLISLFSSTANIHP